MPNANNGGALRRSREAAAVEWGRSFDSHAEARRSFETSGPARRSNEATRARIHAASQAATTPGATVVLVHKPALPLLVPLGRSLAIYAQACCEGDQRASGRSRAAARQLRAWHASLPSSEAQSAVLLPAHYWLMWPVSPGRQPQRSWEQARSDEAMRALRSASTPEARPCPAAASRQQCVSFEDSTRTMSQATQLSSVVSSGGGAWRPGSDRRSSGSGERLLRYPPYLCGVSGPWYSHGPSAAAPWRPGSNRRPFGSGTHRHTVCVSCSGLCKAFGRAVWCCITLPA